MQSKGLNYQPLAAFDYEKITLRRKVILVGVTGLEPAASTSQTDL